MIDFLVLGLPRSGTTWIANWLTTDATLCLHDPFAESLPEDWPQDHRRRGVSCTGAYLLPGWLRTLDCPVAVIERDTWACDASLAARGLGDTSRLQGPLKAVEGRRFAYADLWGEEGARALWDYLLPGMAFDAIRYRLLREMRIEPRTLRWNASVAEELLRRGWLVTED